VDRSFRDVIEKSPEAQYLIDLHAAGLEVEHQDPSLSLADRREQLDRYRPHWDSLQWVEQSSFPIPRVPGGTADVEGGVVCYVLGYSPGPPTIDYHFVQLPSVLRAVPLKQWTLHGLPNHQSPGLFPEEDLLVICSPIDNNRYLSQKVHTSTGSSEILDHSKSTFFGCLMGNLTPMRPFL
jgi:hypothetical protein